MVTVRPAPPEHFGWLAEQAKVVIGASFRAMEAVDAQGRILAMVGFDGWTPAAVMLHVALEHPGALRHVLRPAFGLVFDPEPRGCAKTLINATVLGDNAKSLRLVKHLGFRETHRVRDGWDRGIDIVLFEMRRQDCRWVDQEAAWAA